MSSTSTVHAVTTIGMDMGKNTLHMIGLDLRGARACATELAKMSSRKCHCHNDH